MADSQDKQSTKQPPFQNNKNFNPTTGGNHRRVYTEGPYSRELGELSRGLQGLKEEEQMQFDEEELGSADGDGVPIYSNSGVSYLIDHKQIQQMLMSDPAQLQALLGKDVDYQQLCEDMVAKMNERAGKEGLFVVGDDEDDEFDYIDINSLPNDQQQYFLQIDGASEDGNNNELEGNNVQFYENLDEIDDEQRELSNYGEDLADLYENDDDNVDLIKYQGIHLMNRQYEEGEEDMDEQEERYSCPETGAHFEFLEMCRRLKKLQGKRRIVDKALEEEENRRDQALLMRKQSKELGGKNRAQDDLEQQALGQEGTMERLKQERDAQIVEVAQLKKAKEDIESQMAVQPDNKAVSEVVTSHHDEDQKELGLLEQIQKKGYSQQQQEDYAKAKQVKAHLPHQALPTENILMTEEGNGSLNFYGLKTSTDKKSGVTSKRLDTANKNAYLHTQEDDISEFIGVKKGPQPRLAGVVNLQQLLKENDIINKKGNPTSNQLHCLTEINEKYSSREKKQPTFKGNGQPAKIRVEDRQSKSNAEVFSFNKELIQKQLQKKEQESNLNQKKKKQTSRSNSKKRQSSNQNVKQTQFQKLLLSFTKNESTKSRASNDKSVYGGTKANRITERINNQVFTGGPNIMINNGVVINQGKNQPTNQIYSSIGMLNKPTCKNYGQQSNNVIQKRKNNGLLPRGNTIDNRAMQQHSTTNNTTIAQHLQSNHAQAAASHSTTVGMTSYTGSRPESAIKKKLGLSPQSINQMPKFNYHQKKPSQHIMGQPSEFKNLVGVQGKEPLEEKKVKLGTHKKVNSMNFKNIQITKSGSNYSKGMNGLIAGRNKEAVPKMNPTLDQNSLALEQILNSQLEVVGPVESQYQTFNDLINNTVVGQTHCSSKGAAFFNKGSGSKQPGSQKYRTKSTYKPNSRQKTKQELNLQSQNDPMHMEMESLLKQINLQGDAGKKRTSAVLASGTNKNQSKTYLPSQYSSITNGLTNPINFPSNTNKQQRQLADPNKRYNSTKQSSRDPPAQKTRSKDSKSSRLSAIGTKAKPVNVAVQPFHVKAKNRPSNGGGNSYDFRGERCETVS